MEIKIPNYIQLLASEDNDFYLRGSGLSELFTQILSKKSALEISKYLDVSDRLVYYYRKNKKTPPIKSITKLADKNQIDYIYRNFEKIYTWGHCGVSLPKEYSPEIAYLSGMILGDGHVSKRTEITICTDSKGFGKRVLAKAFLRTFGYQPKFVEFDNFILVVVGSRPIHFFFSKVIGLPTGNKKGRMSIPSFVYLDKEFKVNFLRGLFDSDGGVTIDKNGKKSILISSSTLPFLLEVHELLQELGVHFGGPYKSGNRMGNEIRTYRKEDIIKFKEVIGSLHPIKSARLMPQ